MKVCQGLQDFRGRWEYKFKKTHTHNVSYIGHASFEGGG